MIVINFIKSILKIVFKTIFPDKDKFRNFFGLYIFIGLYGSGKTISITRQVHNLIKRYGKDSFVIYTDYDLYIPDMEIYKITSYNDLIQQYDKPVLFLIDELQNIFNSRDFKNFPIQVLQMLTQNRKQRKMILATTQAYDLVDINFRRLSYYLINCNILFKYLCFNDYYKHRYDPPTDTFVNELKFSENFFISNKLMKMYNTDQVVDAETINKYIDTDKSKIDKIKELVN